MNIKISQLIAMMLFLTACAGTQEVAAPTTVPVDQETSEGISANSPTQSSQEAGSTTIEGTVAQASPSAGLITLMEPVQGFDVIAVTEATELIDGEGNELLMNQIERGTYVRAQGEPGQTGALIATQILLYPPNGRQFIDFPVQLTYLGADGNVWVYKENDQSPERVTSEAIESSSGSSIEFRSPRLSSDGLLIAVERQERTLRPERMVIQSSLWVYEVSSRSATKIYDEAPRGFDWKPGSHLLAYSPTLNEAYFKARGVFDPDYATNVLGYDHDSGVTTELVRPEGGFALRRPTWSPSGRFLSFEEVQAYEGSGWFAYFDFESDSYTSWGTAIGNYDWALDGESILYDDLSYAASGQEGIWLADRDGSDSRKVSPDFSFGNATQPVYSPDGDMFAYLYYRSQNEGGLAHVYVQGVNGGEPTDLGAFDNASGLDWAQDGQTLVIEAAGPSGQQEILVTYLDSNEIDSIAIGTELSLAQRAPAGEGLSDWMAAERALRSFFEHLNTGNYAAAVDLYGGSYEVMRDQNPGIPQNEPALLLQAACEINGAQCLLPARIWPLHQTALAEGQYLFSVQFMDDNGSLLSTGPCCGGDSPKEKTEFEFRVVKSSEYRFLVLDPPIYLP